MFSGGLDSFLSAVRAVKEGYSIELITFDNGLMSGIDNIRYSGDKLVAEYEDCVEKVKVINSSAVRMLLSGWYDGHTLEEVAKKYYRLIPYQVNCLHCHTAMYVKAIEYCVLNGISTIFNGARECQGFIVESAIFVHGLYKSFACRYGIDVKAPILDMSDDIERLLELADCGFVGRAYEGQCWLGCPVRGVLSDDDISCYVSYFNDILLPVCEEWLDSKLNSVNRV